MSVFYRLHQDQSVGQRQVVCPHGTYELYQHPPVG